MTSIFSIREFLMKRGIQLCLYCKTYKECKEYLEKQGFTLPPEGCIWFSPIVAIYEEVSENAQESG